MKDDFSKGNDLFDAIKRGNRWSAENIRKDLAKIIDENYSSSSINHEIQWDDSQKSHYIYDDECILNIFSGAIKLKCDRENVFSSNMNIEYTVSGIADIKAAYERFRSMTMEAEEQDDDDS